MKMAGIINKIIPFSNVDGPGNRTAVFLQGCNLRCLFCHNPETIHRCIGCGKCVELCPAGALTSPCSPPSWNPQKCVSCDACIKACPHLSSPKVRLMTAEEVAAEIRKTAPYINGVSFSGGECTLQRDFLMELIPLIRDMGLGVLLDSNGSYDFEQDPALLALIDGVMLDIKAASPAFCRALTGAGPDLPLKNLDYLQKVGKLAEVRTVIFPESVIFRDKAPKDAAPPAGDGILHSPQNDTNTFDLGEENRRTLAAVAPRLDPAIPYKLLRYRPFGVRQEGLDYLGSEIPTEEQGEVLTELVCSLGAQGRLV